MKSVKGRLEQARKRENWLSKKLVEMRVEVMKAETELEKLQIDIASLEEQLEDRE